MQLKIEVSNGNRHKIKFVDQLIDSEICEYLIANMVIHGSYNKIL